MELGGFMRTFEFNSAESSVETGYWVDREWKKSQLGVFISACEFNSDCREFSRVQQR